jgi:PAS domain S-box-containing protein
MAGVTLDITERRRAEDAVRESRQHLVSIYNTVEDVIFSLAIEPEGQFRFTSVNAAFLRVTGLNPEAVIGKTVNEVVPEPSRPMVLKKYRQAIEEKTIIRWEETSDYPAGRLTGHVSVAPVFDNTGTCTHLVGSFHDITGIKRAQEIEERLVSDLAVSRDEIRALAVSLMKAQDEERRRISRDLHDHICHQLAFVALDIDKLLAGPLPPENARARLEAIQTRVVKTSQEAHQIAYQMRISVLDDLGLVTSLKDLCNHFTEQYPDVAVDFEETGVPDSMQSEVASCFYRVAEESLQNVAKHSCAKNVSVRLGFEKGAVVLTIQDDGVGMDPKAVKRKSRLGLINMEERARSVKGKLMVTAQLGRGTQVALEVPLQTGNP